MAWYIASQAAPSQSRRFVDSLIQEAAILSAEVSWPGKFQYVSRPSCVCGRSLDNSSGKITKSFAWGEVQFLECVSCGCWCQSPQIGGECLTAWYDSDEYQGSRDRRGSAYVNYLADETQRIKEAAERFKADLAPYLPGCGGCVLEVGCATGSLLSVIRDVGHEVAGIDLSRRFADAAKQLHGLEVQVADILSAKIPDGSFDMVLLFGTLSNLSDIPRSLRRIHGLLKPGGVLVANYPAADSIVAKLYGERFWMFAPSASTFMTSMGCGLALKQAGFHSVESGLDRQMPSFRKLFTHAKCHALLSVLDAFGLGNKSLPFRLPVPGVRIVRASRG